MGQITDITNGYKIPSSFMGYCCFKREGLSLEYIQKQLTALTHQKPTIALETESFLIALLLSPSIKIGQNLAGNITVILHGEIYEPVENQASYLAQQWELYGDNAVKDFHGSFALLLVDKKQDRVALITDRLNSRRIFVSQIREGFFLTSNFAAQPSQSLPFDLTGIAWYLADGFVRNDRTLFEGISIFKRACIHELTRQGFQAKRYWNIDFNSSGKLPNQQQLSEELSQLLIQSVKRRLYDNPNLFLSLSAGYDATSLLGILANDLQMSGVYCFSYDHGVPKINSDAYIAKLMAESVGYPHETIESYTGNFLNHILENAQRGLGQALSWYCAESGVWKILAQRFSTEEKPVLFVGHVFNGPARYQWQNRGEVLISSKIYGFEALSYLTPFLTEETSEKMAKGLAEDMTQILNSFPSTMSATIDYYNFRNFLVLDQSLNSWLLPYTESHAGQFVKVRYPLLDNELLDFMAKIPLFLRQNKLLYRNTLTQRYPQLFQFPRSTIPGNYYLNLDNEFRQNTPIIEAIIKNQPSRLDELIPPDIFLTLLQDTLEEKNLASEIPAKTAKEFKDIWQKFRGKLNRFFPPQPGNMPTIQPSKLLLRLMILRTLLSQTNQ